jgi:histone-lysine N-methyltransferase MLL2
LFSRSATAQHSVPPSVEPAQSEGWLQAIVSAGAHVVSQLVAAVVVFAQHVPVVHGVPGQLPGGRPPLELPLLLPLLPPEELPPLLLPPEELPPLLLPPEELPPLLLPPEDELALPEELPLPPPEPLLPPVIGVVELLHAIHTKVLATTSAPPRTTETERREAMCFLPPGSAGT